MLVRHSVEAMELVDAIYHGIRKRILLRIDCASFDGFDEFRQVHGLWLSAQELERARLYLARPHANSHPLHVSWRVNWPQGVGELTETGLEVTEDAAVHARFEPCAQHLPKTAIYRRTGRLDAGKQIREIGHAKVRHLIGEIAARLVCQRQHAVLDHPVEVVLAVAKIENVVDVFDINLIAESRF